jgi:flagellar motility protein MotE (MotC chaperone)
MYILEEENKDLREDYERLKTLTYEDKMKRVMEENETLRKRNGHLLI